MLFIEYIGSKEPVKIMFGHDLTGYLEPLLFLEYIGSKEPVKIMFGHDLTGYLDS